MSEAKQIEIQREYYKNTAANYSELHVVPGDEHYFSLCFLSGMIEYYGIESILDVGAGTGRAAVFLKNFKPSLRIVSIEPVRELREHGQKMGLSEAELVDGDATNLAFSDREFDLVCEFGVLHHIPRPERAAAEMLRVSRKGVFISDSNNFGQGSIVSRTIKQIANAVGMWPVLDFIKTKGKGYHISEGDGLAYSYSVFNNYRQIESACRRIHLVNTMDGRIDPYKTASHVALLGVK